MRDAHDHRGALGVIDLTPENWPADSVAYRWKESGLSSARLAADIGVNAKTLAWWREELARASAGPKRALVKDRTARPVTLAPLKFIEMTARSDGGAVEVVLPSGVAVRVRPGFDTATLVRVLDVVESRQRFADVFARCARTRRGPSFRP